MADAGIPMRDLVCATGVGKAYGEILLDLNKDEEDASDAVDIPFGILPRTGEIVLLQMDGMLTKDEWKKCYELGLKGCQQVYEVQKKALVSAFDTRTVAEPATENGA
jgi:exosome complex component RRP41